jgi:AraC family transcriptional regulator of adaptative response/methylated-DNA-[protein]-cysteine methyltransferase
MIAMAEERGLILLEFLDRSALTAELEELRSRYGYRVVPGTNHHLEQTEAELQTYFNGQLKEFTVALHMLGSSFDKSVWSELLNVTYGQTSTYSGIAATLGKPSLCRAVGAANGRNRISIIVPCHRVVAADGALTGYGGGQPRKVYLLRLKKAVMQIVE